MANRKINHIQKAKALLGQALAAAAEAAPLSPVVGEARRHMRQALEKLDGAMKGAVQSARQNHTQYDAWWGDVEAGASQVAASPMAPEAQVRSLAQLDALIGEERRKLDELEKASQAQPASAEDLLNG